MQAGQYRKKYQQLQLIQNNASDDYKLYLVKQIETSAYRTAKKTSIYDCSDKSQDQLLNQVRILRQLSNPHIIKYSDVFLQQDDFIVILEFCEQGDLEHYAKRKKEKKQNFSEKLILSWVLQILMGLEYIHSKNIIHRMVNSHNIFMNHQGDLKLGSFGGAKMLQSSLEKAMTVVGSPCNLSPQVVEGKPYDNKLDIWALGCLIYELTTFQHPFKINNLPQLYELIVKNPPQDLPVKYSKYLNPIYKKMMKKNPSFRPSATQLLQEQIFIKLMKQYTKKKKIDSLDLRQVIPKQLIAHNRNKNPKSLLPPLPNIKSPIKMETTGKVSSKKKTLQNQPIDKSKEKSREKEKQRDSSEQTNSKLPMLSSTRYSDNEDQSANTSPNTGRKQGSNLPTLTKAEKPSPKLNKSKSEQQGNKNKKQSQSEKITAVQQNKKSQDKNTEGKPEQNRLTLPDLMQGQYISLLCQIKLQLLQKKYSPNMSQIFQQTVQFDEQQQ